MLKIREDALGAVQYRGKLVQGKDDVALMNSFLTVIMYTKASEW